MALLAQWRWHKRWHHLHLLPLLLGPFIWTARSVLTKCDAATSQKLSWRWHKDGMQLMDCMLNCLFLRLSNLILAFRKTINHLCLFALSSHPLPHLLRWPMKLMRRHSTNCWIPYLMICLHTGLMRKHFCVFASGTASPVSLLIPSPLFLKFSRLPLTEWRNKNSWQVTPFSLTQPLLVSNDALVAG